MHAGCKPRSGPSLLLLITYLPRCCPRLVTSDSSKYFDRVLYLCRLQEYGNDQLKKYYSQEGYLVPADVIEARARAKDYNFFLSTSDFLKMADSLERYT